MGACVGAEQSSTIKAKNIPKPQKAVIKDTSTTIVSQTVAPRALSNAPDIGGNDRVHVRVHLHELELNDNIEEPWVCMGENEEEGCQSDEPQF